MQVDTERALALLFKTGQVVELRAILETGYMASGYFDDMAKLASASEKMEAGRAQGIYVTLNEVDPNLIARSANRMKTRLGKKDQTTADENIKRRIWFPIDIDASRPSGISASDSEHEAALLKAERVLDYLSAEGWPDPIFADSGNGAHLLYATDFPNDTECRDLVKKGLESLALQFDDKSSTIDTGNFNAARIWKLYGTISRKGDDTKSRPHRRSQLISVPDLVERISREQLDRLAGALKCTTAARAAEPAKPVGQPIDLGKWLRDHSLGIADEKPYEGGILFNLEECPFSGAHRDGAFAIQFPSGGIHAGCHHSSCGSGKQQWPELREKYEPKADRVKGKQPKTPTPPISPAPAPKLEDLQNIDEAKEILLKGDPMKFMLDTFALDHIGDEVPAECLILSLASRSVENTSGLHVSVSGESGKGKSDLFNKILKQVPDRFRLEGAMSNKALFYMQGMSPGTAIVFDDKSISEEVQEILKGATSSFNQPIKYRTVSKERRIMICVIPERCLWWIAKVEGSGDDQVCNRMLSCWIDDSAEQDSKVLAAVLLRASEIPNGNHKIRPEVLTCQAMWEVLSQERIYVVIPYSDRVEFQRKDNRRNPEMFFDIIRAHALLFSLQRERHTIEGDNESAYIIANLEDYDAAVRMYGVLNSDGGGQETKLTRKEAELLTAIYVQCCSEFTIREMQTVTEFSHNAIYRLLHGYTSRDQNYSGLLDKCPAISVADRTDVMDEELGKSVRRRVNAYQFNRDLYLRWKQGCAVWLKDDLGPGGPSPCCGSAEGNELFAADSASTKSALGDEDSINEPYITNKNVCTVTNCGKNSYTATPTRVNVSAVPSLCEDLNSASDNIETPPSGGNADQNVLQSYGHSGCPSIKQEKTYTGLRIAAQDYKILDRPEYHTICRVCGRKGTDYIEKLTAERKARPDKVAYRICRKCYQAAVRIGQASAPPLHGTIVLSRMVRITKDIGRCSVCNLGPAIFTDKEAGTKICQQCYDRETKAAGMVHGGASL